MIRVRQLEYIVAVAECGSITAAAQELFLSQPALTKAILNLEHDYKVRLFDRTPRGVDLTAEGRLFVDHARAVIAATGAMNKAFAAREGPERKVLSVASQQFDFLYELLLDCYESWSDNAFHLNLVECDRGGVIRAVLSGEVDLGLLVQSDGDSQVFSRLLEERRLESTRVAESAVYVSCGPKSPLYDYPSDRIPVERIEASTQLILDMEGEVVRTLHAGGVGHHLQAEKLVSLNSASACIQFLLRTDASLFTPSWVVGFFRETPIRTRLVDFSDSERFPTNHLHWVKRLHEPLNVAGIQFVEGLQRAVGASAEPARR